MLEKVSPMLSRGAHCFIAQHRCLSDPPPKKEGPEIGFILVLSVDSASSLVSSVIQCTDFVGDNPVMSD